MIKRLLLGMLLASAPSLMAQSAKGHGGGSGTALNVQSLASDPGTCTNAQIWYNTSSNTYKICPNGSVVAIAAGGSVTTIPDLTPLGTFATRTTAPVWTLSTQTALFVFGNCTGSTAAPSFCALTGAMLPNPSASTLGGIESLAVVSHKWINTISTSGVPAATQPTLADIAAGQAPTGTFDFSATTHTLPAVVGLAAAKPGTCTAGELYFATDATAGQNLYECGAANTWTQQLNTGGGSSAWSSLTAPTGAGNWPLAMGSNTSIFTTTTALSQMFGWKNVTAAVVGTSQGSPIIPVCGTAFHGSASVESCATWAILPGNGNDAAIVVSHAVTGTSTGQVTDQFPGWIAAGNSGGAGGGFSFPEGTTLSASSGNDLCYADSTSHFIKCSNNNGSFLTLPYETGTMTSGDLTQVNATTNLISDSGIAVANVATAASNYVSGNLVQGAGANKTTSDSGVATANVVTQTSNASSGQICTYTGANKICVPASALPNPTTTATQAADDNSTKVATTAYVDRLTARGISFTIGDPTGSALTTSQVSYVTVPFACTIAAYNILVDAGTITLKTWKIATGTAIPTSANSISTSGVSISSGTAIHSTTVTDFTTTTVTANDIVAAAITAVSTAKFVNFTLQCNQ